MKEEKKECWIDKKREIKIRPFFILIIFLRKSKNFSIILKVIKKMMIFRLILIELKKVSRKFCLNRKWTQK